MNLKLDKLPLDHSGNLGDLLTVFAAPKRIRLKSYMLFSAVPVKSFSITSSDVSTHFGWG
jgi:hypothetical protein